MYLRHTAVFSLHSDFFVFFDEYLQSYNIFLKFNSTMIDLFLFKDDSFPPCSFLQAHFIKDRRCNTARAVFALESEYKWALSGTPLQNRVGELYSLVCN